MRLSARAPGLRTIMVLSFIAVVILTAVAAWLPEVWLIRGEFERQSWARVEQGRRAARTLYNAWQNEVSHAAVLTAQLPTLQTLLASGSSAELAAYLETVETSLVLDVMIACDADGAVAAQVGAAAIDDPCALDAPVGFYVLPAAEGSPAWLLATEPVRVQGAQAGRIVAGIHLNDAFAARVRGETELQHTLLVDGEPVATSFSAGVPFRAAAQPETRGGGGAAGERTIFSLPDERTFYAARLPLDNPRLANEVAFAAAEITATQAALLRSGTLSLILAVLFGSLAAIVVSRQISKPLLQLDRAAARLRHGRLDEQIAAESNIREVARVAETLEHTRVDLLQTLGTLEAEKAWRAHLLEAIVEGIMVLDEAGRITYFSAGAARITGWQQGQVRGQLADDVFQPADNGQPFCDLIPPPGRRRTVWVALADGHVAALSMTRAELVPPGADARQIAIVFRDVSEEEAVQRLVHNFLANITHEFRTPLTALAASAELLVDEAETLTPEELAQMLTWLHLGILGLQTLVDNLLETASLEAGEFQIAPRPSDLEAIILEATRLMEPLLKKYNQRLAVALPDEPLPAVHADSRRVVQVLVNLLSNANKYAPPDSAISVRAARQAGAVRVEVADRGPGVPAGESKLFHRFLHLSVDADQKRSGVGLGLWVVKAIVEAHGGRVGADERPGGGSVFWFTLPPAEET